MKALSLVTPFRDVNEGLHGHQVGDLCPNGPASTDFNWEEGEANSRNKTTKMLEFTHLNSFLVVTFQSYPLR